MIISNERLQHLTDSLDKTLARARSQDFSGYSKFDALNAPVLETAFGWNPVLRLLTTQVVTRMPINLRGLFGVKKSRNPKGIANFIKTLCNLYILSPQDELADEINALCAWLVEQRSDKKWDFSGICWGYNFPWQSPGFYAPRFFPNAIVTTFCSEAFLKAYQALGNRDYLEIARDSSRYLLEDLPTLEDFDQKKCLGYVTAPLSLKVININAVVGGFLAKLSLHSGHEEYLVEAKKLIAWTIGTKTEYGAWYYTHPRTVYVRDHDNYHTGGILDGIFDYMEASQDFQFLEDYLKGLKFYGEELFEPSGAAKWRNTSCYPHDVHGSAQGIISFGRAGLLNPIYYDLAIRIAEWAIIHLQNDAGGFYYQQKRLFTWKLELMRWGNSWMAWALSELLLSLAQQEREPFHDSTT